MHWTLILGLVVVGHWLVIVYLLHKLRQRRRINDDLDPILQKTKFQLHREIARHESTEILLTETRDYLHCLINSLPAIVIGVTDDGYVTHWNTAAEKHTGLSHHRAMGHKLSTVLHQPDVSTDDIKHSIVSGQAILREAIAQGDGADARFTDLIIHPLVSSEVTGAVILIQDVTLKVRVERSMIQNEKMLSLGQMAAGLAHEINNPLAAILSNIQTIQRRFSVQLKANLDCADKLDLNFSLLQNYLEQRDIPGLIDASLNAGERAAKIVKTMLDFSHAHNSEFQAQNIADLIDQSLELAAHTLELKGAEAAQMPFVIRDYKPDLALVECSASEIQQVLLNMLLNAAQAIHSANSDNPTINLRLNREGNFAVISIQDNGPGIPADIQKHIFEPFFTTKKVGSGTGLGLSVSYFIIKDHHNGKIELESSASGSCFKIYLPFKQL